MSWPWQTLLRWSHSFLRKLSLKWIHKLGFLQERLDVSIKYENKTKWSSWEREHMGEEKICPVLGWKDRGSLWSEPTTINKQVLGTFYMPGTRQGRRPGPGLPRACYLIWEIEYVFQKLNTNWKQKYKYKRNKMKGLPMEKRDPKC